MCLPLPSPHLPALPFSPSFVFHNTVGGQALANKDTHTYIYIYTPRFTLDSMPENGSRSESHLGLEPTLYPTPLAWPGAVLKNVCFQVVEMMLSHVNNWFTGLILDVWTSTAVTLSSVCAGVSCCMFHGVCNGAVNWLGVVIKCFFFLSFFLTWTIQMSIFWCWNLTSNHRWPEWVKWHFKSCTISSKTTIIIIIWTDIAIATQYNSSLLWMITF